MFDKDVSKEKGELYQKLDKLQVWADYITLHDDKNLIIYLNGSYSGQIIPIKYTDDDIKKIVAYYEDLKEFNQIYHDVKVEFYPKIMEEARKRHAELKKTKAET